MFEQQYRQRLERDLLRWQADGVITSSSGSAIRATLGPAPKGVDLATSVAIVGGLFISAAFLAFVAANWSEIARPARFVILLVGIVAAYALGAAFDRRGRAILADLCVTTGSVVFGAAIALTGQMYHLGGDFSDGMALWAIGALAAAALTGSRGALAVALTIGCVWHGSRVTEGTDVFYFPFVVFWFAGAALALIWNAPVARHLVSAAAIVSWAMVGAGLADTPGAAHPVFASQAGIALMFGLGILLSVASPDDSGRSLGLTLSHYAAFAFAAALAVGIGIGSRPPAPTNLLASWAIICGASGTLLAFLAAGLARGLGPAFGGAALALGLAAVAIASRSPVAGEAWLSYVLALLAMLALLISGMRDDARPRVMAGWMGLAALIAVITWSVKGSLLRRAIFLAIAGGAAIVLAFVIGRQTKRRAAT